MPSQSFTKLLERIKAQDPSLIMELEGEIKLFDQGIQTNDASELIQAIHAFKTLRDSLHTLCLGNLKDPEFNRDANPNIITEINIYDFPQLRKLNLDDVRLQNLTLRNLPNLESLSARYNPSNIQVTAQGVSDIVYTEPVGLWLGNPLLNSVGSFNPSTPATSGAKPRNPVTPSRVSSFKLSTTPGGTTAPSSPAPTPLLFSRAATPDDALAVRMSTSDSSAKPAPLCCFIC